MPEKSTVAPFAIGTQGGLSCEHDDRISRYPYMIS